MANNSFMQLQTWANEERGRGLLLAKALGVQPPSISDWITGKKQVPAERCPSIEQFTDRQVTCEEMRPDVDWAYLRNSRPELAQAQAEPAQAATDLIALVKTAITETKDAVLHAAEDELHQVKTDVTVELKHTAVEVRTDLEEAQRTAIASKWDGKERRTRPWDGQERREGVDRRNPEVLESPAPIFTPEAAAMARLKTGG